MLWRPPNDSVIHGDRSAGSQGADGGDTSTPRLPSADCTRPKRTADPSIKFNINDGFRTCCLSHNADAGDDRRSRHAFYASGSVGRSRHQQ